MSKTICEKNALLAKFSGGLLIEEDKSPGEYRWWFGFHGEPIGKDAPAFDSDWNWLMKAWLRISLLNYPEKLIVDKMHLGKSSCSINAIPVPYLRGAGFVSFYVVGDKLESNEVINLQQATYEAVVEFVNWYNKQIYG